jgi:hypothetical protein
MNKIFIFLFIGFLLIGFVSSHGDDEANVEDSSSISPLLLIWITSIWVILLIFIIIVKKKNLSDSSKKWFFWLVISPIIITTVYIMGFTVYENLSSISGGPIHWHADYKVYICGEESDLVDPSALRGKVGSSIFHEHNDGRIHIEGTISKMENIDLGSYFEVVGGELEDGHLIYPTNEKVIEVKNGDFCNGKEGNLKVYVNGDKIEEPEEYLIYPDSNVPPGDCIIVVFDENIDETTELICDTWEVNGWNYENYERKPVEIGGFSWK